MSPSDTLTIVDNRTGKKYDLPVQDGTIRAMDLRQIKSGPDDFGLMTYDPAFMNTANCRSAITYIDGDKGILMYRGYPIEDLAQHCDFLEVAYLILYGELPNEAQRDEFNKTVTHHTMVNEQIVRFYSGFRRDAHPMAVLCGVVGALSAFYHDALDINNPRHREISAFRLIAKLPTSSVRRAVCAAQTARTTVKLLQISTAVLVAPRFTSMDLLAAAKSPKYFKR